MSSAPPGCSRVMSRPSWQRGPADMARLARTLRVRQGTADQSRAEHERREVDGDRRPPSTMRASQRALLP